MPLRRLDRLIDPFRHLPDSKPPGDVWRVYAYFLREVRGVFVFLLVVGLAGALIEVALFEFLGRIVDMIQATPGAAFFTQHRNALLWMAFVAVIARPIRPCRTRAGRAELARIATTRGSAEPPGVRDAAVKAIVFHEPSTWAIFS
jgi:hypothetical protein